MILIHNPFEVLVADVLGGVTLLLLNLKVSLVKVLHAFRVCAQACQDVVL